MEKLNYTQQKRKDMIASGAYDGRYRVKVVKNKKKEYSKKWARSK